MDEFDIANDQALLETLIKKAQKYGANSAEANLYTDLGFSVAIRAQKVDTLEYHHQKRVALSVFCGQKTAHLMASDTSPKALDTLAKKACCIASYTEPDPYSGLAPLELMATYAPDLSLYHPWKITTTDAIEMAKSCEQHALDFDPRINQSEGVEINNFQYCHLYANSYGTHLSQLSSLGCLDCQLIARQDNTMQRNGEYTQARLPQQLKSSQWVGQEAAKNTVSRLGGRQIRSKKCPVIFYHTAATSLLKHFTSAIHGISLFREASFLTHSLEKKVFPESVTIYQKPYLKGAMGSAYYDSDGVQTRELNFIEQGRMKNYLLSHYSAQRLGLGTTGNADGAHNLLVQMKTLSFDNLLKEMDSGLLITELMGNGVNIITGDYSRGAFGFWVEHGEIQFPVEQITVAGQLKTLFSHFVAMGSDIDKRGNYQVGSILIEQMTVAGLS